MYPAKLKYRWQAIQVNTLIKGLAVFTPHASSVPSGITSRTFDAHTDVSPSGFTLGRFSCDMIICFTHWSVSHENTSQHMIYQTGLPLTLSGSSFSQTIYGIQSINIARSEHWSDLADTLAHSYFSAGMWHTACFSWPID